VQTKTSMMRCVNSSNMMTAKENTSTCARVKPAYVCRARRMIRAPVPAAAADLQAVTRLERAQRSTVSCGRAMAQHGSPVTATWQTAESSIVARASPVQISRPEQRPGDGVQAGHSLSQVRESHHDGLK
jgi:hypothetical protein